MHGSDGWTGDVGMNDKALFDAINCVSIVILWYLILKSISQQCFTASLHD